MLHCTKCGGAVDAAAPFCQRCGERQPAATVPAGAWPSPEIGGAQSGGGVAAVAPGQAAGAPGMQSALTENVAAALSYSLFWITGIIFLLIDKRPYVRFHAAQSLVLFGAIEILRKVLGAVFGIRAAFGDWDDWRFDLWHDYGPGLTILGLLSLATFVLWLLTMLKAYQGEKFRVPLAADLAESLILKKPDNPQ
jgi:uncharacterized membrane protein